MSVLITTTLGDFVIDCYKKKAPRTSQNFINLCKSKHFHFCTFNSVQKDFTAQLFAPQTCFDAILDSSNPSLFTPERHEKLSHVKKGLVSMSCNSSGKCAASFFITLSDKDLSYFDEQHAVFARIVEGIEVLDAINNAIVDAAHTPYVDIRILHTTILDDPFPETGHAFPSRSPSPTLEMVKKRLDIGDAEAPVLDPEEMARQDKQKEATAQALTLELIGDLPFAQVKPPENVLFVAKLNPITQDEDLELIFSRFGECSASIVRDDSGKSLGYAFIEFEQQKDAEVAYLKMDKVVIDDKRIHVDFSQSVAKFKNVTDDRDEFGKGLSRRRQYRDERIVDKYQFVHDEHAIREQIKGRVESSGEFEQQANNNNQKRSRSRDREGFGKRSRM